MATYSEVEDMLTGNVPVTTPQDAQSFVQDAADEIDSVIGNIYETPIDMEEPTTVSRPARLLLKRISVFISTGRYIMAVSAGTEDDSLNQYGLYLLKQGQDALTAIASGEMILTGATPLNPDSPVVAGPQIANVDPESNVEAFYDRIANPNYFTWPLVGRVSGG